MKTNNENVNSISSLIENIIVFFVSIMIYQSLSKTLSKEYGVYEYYNLYIIMSYMASALLLNSFVSFISLKITRTFKNPNMSFLIEVTFLILFISLPMWLLHSYETEFKFIFLLIVILTVIEAGLKYGILSAIFIDIIILTLDIFFDTKVDGINIQFERDLIMCIIFIFVAWILGQYVTIESNNKIKKEKELQQLNIELLLLKNEVCYNMVFENSQNAIILHDNNKILYANKSAVKLLGYEEATEIINKSIRKHYPKEKIMSITSKYSNIMDKKLSKIVEEETILDDNNTSIEVRNTSSYFLYNGKIYVLTLLLDLTPEKQLEALKNDVEMNLKLLNETKEFNILITEFFTNISHEIKTPINVIYTALQCMNIYLEKHDMNKCKTYLKTMKQNCFRMIRLVNNLLDITKADSGFSKVNRKNGNIVSVVEDITQSVADYVNSKEIELIFDTNVEEKIMAFDFDKIERIMLNLLSNAYKHSNTKGKIFVNLEVASEQVTIIVKDEGEGIRKDKIGIIFERFGQANRSLSRENEGSGIGLYLVKSFVEMHNGRITVNSIEGKGTEFIMVLPVEHVSDEDNINNSFCETNVERINIEFSDIYSISN